MCLELLFKSHRKCFGKLKYYLDTTTTKIIKKRLNVIFFFSFKINNPNRDVTQRRETPLGGREKYYSTDREGEGKTNTEQKEYNKNYHYYLLLVLDYSI